MSQASREPSRRLTELDDLDADERAWLLERLAEYRELLEYLHDH